MIAAPRPADGGNLHSAGGREVREWLSELDEYERAGRGRARSPVASSRWHGCACRETVRKILPAPGRGRFRREPPGAAPPALGRH